MKQKVFIVKKDGKWGFISDKNKKISSFSFDEIIYWQPFVALVREGETYQLYNLQTAEKMFQPIEKIKFISDKEDEIVIKIFSNNKYGLLSSRKGLLIDLEYDELENVGSEEKPFYVAQKFIKEVDVYLLYYFTPGGKLLRKQALTQELYEKVSCD